MTAPIDPRRAADSDVAWNQWFGADYELTRKVDALLDEAGNGHSDAFRTALVAGLIEHLGERLRFALHLPASDKRPPEET